MALRHLYLAVFLVSFLATSCSTNKKVAYFQDLNADSIKVKASPYFVEPVIASDDVLSVSITTIDPQGVAPVNQAPNTPVVVNSQQSNASQPSPGYLVDKDGSISLAMVGKVNVKGLTTYQARELIASKAAKYYKDPNVQVRFINFKVTVLGEVSRPGSYTVPNEKVSVLDALGMAGDMTIYGRRENLLVMRSNGDWARLDLNSSQFLNSPFFYLRQNDVVYVEPNNAKIASTDAAKTRTTTIIASISSALLVLLIRVVK